MLYILKTHESENDFFLSFVGETIREDVVKKVSIVFLLIKTRHLRNEATYCLRKIHG